MITRKFESREEWMNWRLGKLTGSALKNALTLKGNEVKIGIYKAVAGSLIGSAALEDENEERAMTRGTRLERIAIERFNTETGKKAIWSNDDIGWERDDDSRIAISPDAVLGKTAAVEAKCLSAARHVEALYTKKVPKEYELQAIQYFIVNENLKTLYFVFYDDRFPTGLDFMYLTITRAEKEDEILNILSLERDAVLLIRQIVNTLTLYSPEDVAAINSVKEELLETHLEDVEAVTTALSKRTSSRTSRTKVMSDRK